MKPGSTEQVLAQPSPSLMLASSQASAPTMIPSPQVAPHTDGAPAQLKPGSTEQPLEQPSPSLTFASSQVSAPAATPSPQVVSQGEGAPVQSEPGSSVQLPSRGEYDEGNAKRGANQDDAAALASQLTNQREELDDAAAAARRLLFADGALGRRELLEVPHPALEHGRDGGVGLSALLRLVGDDRRLHELPHQALERVVGPLELGRVMDRARRARLAAEAAVHALAHVDVEAGHDEAAGGLVLRRLDDDAVDRAGPLAGE